MRFVGARRHLFLLTASALLFGTVVEEASSGRLRRLTTDIFIAQWREGASQRAARVKRRAAGARPVTHSGDQSESTSARLEMALPEAVSEVPGGSPEADLARSASTLGTDTREQTTAAQTSGHSTRELARQAPPNGFSRTGINPFVTYLLGGVGGATDGLGSTSSADSSTAMSLVFGTSADSMNSVKPTLGLGLFADDVSGITAMLGEGGSSVGGVLGAHDDPRVLAALISDSTGQPERLQEASIAPVGVTVGRPLGSGGLAATPGGSADPTAIPAAVVVDLATTDAREELRAFVSAYYGSEADTSLRGTSLALDLSESAQMGEALVNPEPGTLVLLGSGLLGLTHWVRRKNRRVSRRASPVMNSVQPYVEP